MAGVIRGNLLNGDVAVNPEGPVNLTLKRDDGLPDTEVVTDAQGNWEVTVESASKKKVLFTFFDKSKPLGTHEVDFVKELEIMPASGKFNTEYMNGFHLRLVDANMDPIVGVDVTYEYKYDDATEWVSSTVTTEEGGYAGTMWSANGTDPQKLHIRVSYGDLNDEFVYDFTTQSLSTFFGDTLAPKELAVGEELQLVGRIFPKYGSGAVNFETDAYLGYFSDNALYTKDLSDHLEWGGKFIAKVPEQKVTLLTNNGYTEIAPPVVTDLKAPALFRLSVRSIMINNPDLHYSGSWEMTGRIYTKDFESPNVSTDYLVLHDYNNSPYSDDVYMNSDWAFESWVGSRDGSKSCTATCRGRLLGDNITRYSTLGDMLNLIVGTKNFVHVGREVVNRVGLVDVLGNPKVGETVKFFKGEETTAFGEAVTDSLGVAEITIPAESEVSRQYWRAEVGELVLGYYNDWVPETVPLAETVNTPFIPALIEPERGWTFKLNGIDKNGTPLPLNDNMMYEGIVVQCLENWYLRSYVSSASDGTYDYRLALSDSTAENVRLTIGLACDHFHTEKEVVVGKVEGLNPLPYAQGTSVAGRSLVSGWRLLDAELNPVAGSIVQVWLDDKTGEADFNLTTDKYGIVHFTAPYEEGNLVRKAYAQSGDQEHTLELMWTEKQAGCDITVGIPDFVATEEQTTFNVRTLDQMGNEVNEESPQLYTLGRYGLNIMAYRKSTGEIIPLGMDRTSDLNIMTGVEEGEQDYVIYTEAGFKEFTVNAVKRPTRNVQRVPYSSSNAFPESDALVAFNVVDENNLGVPGETVEIRYLGLEVDKLIGNSWVRVYEGGSDEVIATLVTDEFGIVEFPVTTPAGTGTHGWGATRVNPGPKDTVGEAKIYVHWRDAIVTSLRDFKSIPVTESGEYSAYSAEVWENVSATEEAISDSNQYLEVYVKELNRTLYTMSDFYKGRSVGVIEEALPDGTYNAVIYTQNARHEFTITWGAVTPVVPTELNYNSFQAKKYPAAALLYSSVSLNDANGPITQITKSHKVVVYNSGGQNVGSGFVDIDGTANIRWETSWGVPKPTETYEFRIGSDVLFSMTADLVVNPQVSVAPYTLSNPVIGYPVLTGALVENETKDAIVSGIYVTLEDNYGNVYAEGETDEFGFFDAMYERVGTESHMFVRPRCGQSTTYQTGPWVDTSVSRYVDLRFIDPPATVDSDSSVYMNGMMYDQNGTPANSVSYYVYDVRNRQRIGGTSKSDGRIEPWLSNIQLGKNPVIVYSANGLAKHVVEYKSQPVTAEVIGDPVPTSIYKTSSEIELQLKGGSGANYSPSEGETVHFLAKSGRYQENDIPINPDGTVKVHPWTKGFTTETYVVANHNKDKSIAEVPVVHEVVSSTRLGLVSNKPRVSEDATVSFSVFGLEFYLIPDVEVTLYEVGSEDVLVTKGRTNANGSVTLTVPTNNEVGVRNFKGVIGNDEHTLSIEWVSDATPRPASITWVDEPTAGTQYEGAIFNGTLLDQNGDPIPNEPIVTDNLLWESGIEDYWTTNADGTFSVEFWPEPGSHPCSMMFGNIKLDKVLDITTENFIEYHPFTTRDVPWEESALIMATQTDQYNKPTVGVDITFRLKDENGDVLRTVTTDESGYARYELTWAEAQSISNDPDANGLIHVSGPLASRGIVITTAKSASDKMLKADPVIIPVRSNPEQVTKLAGVAVDKNLNVKPGLRTPIYLLDEETGEYRQSGGSSSNTDGHFTLPVGPKRYRNNKSYTLVAGTSITQYVMTWDDVDTPLFSEILIDSIPGDIYVGEAFSFSGTAKDDNRAPLSAPLELEARIYQGTTFVSNVPLTTKPDGTWSFETTLSTTGVHTVWLATKGGSYCHHKEVEVKVRPKPTNSVVVANYSTTKADVGSDITIAGFALDVDGQPIVDTTMTVEDMNTNAEVASGKTDEFGFVELKFTPDSDPNGGDAYRLKSGTASATHYVNRVSGSPVATYISSNRAITHIPSGEATSIMIAFLNQDLRSSFDVGTIKIYNKTTRGFVFGSDFRYDRSKAMLFIQNLPNGENHLVVSSDNAYQKFTVNVDPNLTKVAPPAKVIMNQFSPTTAQAGVPKKVYGGMFNANDTQWEPNYALQLQFVKKGSTDYYEYTAVDASGRFEVELVEDTVGPVTFEVKDADGDETYFGEFTIEVS